MKKQIMLVVIALAVIMVNSGHISAQQREFAVLLGGNAPSDRGIQSPLSGKISIGTGLTYGLNYGQRLLNARVAALYFEVHLAATPTSDLNSSNTTIPREYSSVFLTPGLRVKLLPGAGISPYVVVGAGYARFGGSDSRLNGQPNTGDKGANTGVFTYGGGVDIRVWRLVALRGEIRDFVSGNPHFNVGVSGSRQHNIITSGGIVVRF
jgi:opacity protein-like surface antigen